MESIPIATVNDDPLFDLAHFFEQSSYDDDVIEDLPTFLEMATYEDPIDDLATFFEKACRWSASMFPWARRLADKILQGMLQETGWP